ncbi:hypothetical protein MMC28_008171 [Mycoblastus sanguinarius]|nr:hypothetical protein [Mycoblastus sanguinarius]
MERDRSTERILKGLLGYETVNRLTCPNCDDVTDHRCSYYSLDVHLKRGRPLEQILREKTFGKSVAPGRRCSRCRTTSDTEQYERMITAPEVLVIHLLRFEPTQRRQYSRKQSDPIPFTQDLDLTPFTVNNTILKYRLLAVIHHQGSIEFGHYKTVAKAPGGKWEELEDKKVKKVSINAALDPENHAQHRNFSGSPWTPYMLFWTRIDGHIVAQTVPGDAFTDSKHREDHSDILGNTNGRRYKRLRNI